MIIDMHTHIIQEKWLPSKWWQWLYNYYNKNNGIKLFKQSRTYNEVINSICDPNGEKLIESMNNAGIDVSVVLPLDFGLLLGEPEISINDQNKIISEICQSNSKRLIPFVGVDPRRKNAKTIVKQGLTECGMKGIKLYPASGFYPAQKEVIDILETIFEFNVPVIFHTGEAFGPLLSKYCNPIYLDELQAKFPELIIIAAHLGSGWFDELCWLGYTKDNIYSDISLMQIYTQIDYNEFSQKIRKALTMLGMDKILFGTDWPFTNSLMNPLKYINKITNLLSHKNSYYSKSEINSILGKNAKKILKL